jgi:hypothetical protein
MNQSRKVGSHIRVDIYVCARGIDFAIVSTVFAIGF